MYVEWVDAMIQSGMLAATMRGSFFFSRSSSQSSDTQLITLPRVPNGGDILDEFIESKPEEIRYAPRTFVVSMQIEFTYMLISSRLV